MTVNQVGWTKAAPRSLSPASVNTPKAGAVHADKGTRYNPDVVVYRHEPGPVPTAPELAIVHKRLEDMHTILSAESARLNRMPEAAMSAEDVIRLGNLKDNSCVTAAIQVDRAAAGEKAVAINLLDDMHQMNARGIMGRVNGNAPITLPGTAADLHTALGRHLQRPGSRAIVVIDRADGTPGHAFNAENINGKVWLFEAHDGVAVPLHGQPTGVVGVEGFYPLRPVKKRGGYTAIVTKE